MDIKIQLNILNNSIIKLEEKVKSLENLIKPKEPKKRGRKPKNV